MADIPRQSSPRTSTPLSSSPSRPSPLSRPHWPYTTYTHRPSSSAASSQSSSSFTSATHIGESTSRAMSSASTSPNTLLSSSTSTPMRRSSSLMNTAASIGTDENMRQWSFHAFEWIVRDVSKLRDHVESDNTPLDDAGDFEVLKESPMLGDGKFKLEIARSPNPELGELGAPVIKTHPSTLSLYVTAVILEFSHADYEISASLFAAIKCQDDRVGERGARADWAWEFWQSDWVFREDSEVWECPLPPLSALLDNSRIRETDSFVICVQVHSPTGPFFPQQPSATYVPKDLLDGLEASLDNADTGDVQFICLERRDAQPDLSNSPLTEVPSSRRSSSSSTSSTSASQTVARKRIIYAHSDILKRRSEYFATMLNSSFSENITDPRSPERKRYTIMVEEADFVTIYWLLKWVYANWLHFKEHDDPKAAVDGLGAGWSAKTLRYSDASDEWDWKTFNKHVSGESSFDGETRSVTSASSLHSGGDAGRNPSSMKGKQSLSAHAAGAGTSNARSTSATSTGSPRSPNTTKSSSSAPNRPPSSPSRRMTTGATPAGNSSLTVPPSSSTSPSRSKPIPVPISTTATPFAAGASHFPLSPRQQRQRSRPALSTASDPHSHPTLQPPPASALSMYQIAHRYEMPGLATLALEHMMCTISPSSSFALLLATSVWDELHTLIEDYVVDKWDDVSVSTEFEQCCQEVAAGEWGTEGGKTMMALFRRLRSPSSVAYPRA